MPLRRTWTWEFAAARDRLWTYLGDTDWVNEHAGLPRISAWYEPLSGAGTRRMARIRRGPFSLEWEERPTLWQAPEFHEVERAYVRGPLRTFRSRTALEALDAERTRVRLDVELSARTALFEPLLPVIAAQGKRGADRAFTLAADLASRDGRLPENAQAALTAFLENAEDRDVRRMRPYELADRWKLPRREVLREFLHATRAGRLNLRWTVLCPGCRGPAAGVETLQDLKRETHCDACDVSFDALFDRSVEVTFDARPLRPRLDLDATYCIASPQRSPHVHVQRALEAQASQTLRLHLEPGVYDVNASGLHAAPVVLTANAAQAGELPIHILPQHVSVPHEFPSGSLQVNLVNRTDRRTIVRIEDGRWPDTVASAAHVTALEEFRHLFSSEVLAPGLELGVETIAVLFTDLVGSTAMYARTGDAPAFRIVTDHFSVIREIVERYEGAVVKTIGDAVMAVFVSPENALRAALELDRGVQAVTCRGVPLRLRAGMHAGPCIAMRANDRIDYFGTTVNLAARLESLASAGEVTMARSDAGHAGIESILSAFPDAIAHEELPVKGFARPIGVVRLRVPARVPPGP